MEFIFQLFAQMMGNHESEISKEQIARATNEAESVADYESEAVESPLSALNIFEMVDFH